MCYGYCLICMKIDFIPFFSAMWLRRVGRIGQCGVPFCVGNDHVKFACCSYSSGSDCLYLRRNRKKDERKPMVTGVTELKREARVVKKQRQVVQEISLKPPGNGLLVKELIPVAHEVYAARAELLACVAKVADSIRIYTCSVCEEVHVGDPPHQIRTCDVRGSLANKEHTWRQGGKEHIMPIVDSFHLYDRVGRAVSHNECLQVDRIPAIVELCIQAGVDITEYPTRRRDFPIYNISGRIIDFERRFPKDDLCGKDIDTFGFWKRQNNLRDKKSLDNTFDDLQDAANRGLEAWEKLQSGTAKLMQHYAVQTCGYCSEVQVGPKGHRVRNCYSYKHQMRAGQHAWQDATVDDVVPPVYVWHVPNLPEGKPLVNDLKRYYGMLPAVVELFSQAGAYVGRKYIDMMREDIAVPELHEERLVV